MKTIKVYGTGCSKCQQLEANAKEAIQSLGIEAEVVKVKDINAIVDAGIMVTPALAIDGEVKIAQKVASVNEIIGWLRA